MKTIDGMQVWARISSQFPTANVILFFSFFFAMQLCKNIENHMIVP
jgi:hypothetical protein